MKNFALGLLLGIIVGLVGAWYYVGIEQTPSRPMQTVQENAKTLGQQATGAAAEAAKQLSENMRTFHLTPEEIRKELNQTGKVVRRNAVALGNAIKETASDARITAAIKADYARDPDLSAWDISVSTTDGQVSLSGKVRSPDLIGKAMEYALETKGVDVVISTIQVENDQAA
jgi:osmotically-inducible protein OsmY